MLFFALACMDVVLYLAAVRSGKIAVAAALRLAEDSPDREYILPLTMTCIGAAWGGTVASCFWGVIKLRKLMRVMQGLHDARGLRRGKGVKGG